MRRRSNTAGLGRWMRAVGAFYLLLPLVLLPPLSAPLLRLLYPALGAADAVEVRALADVWWLLALGLGVVGALLLRGASRPEASLPLVRLVLAWESVVGVGGGLYLLARGDMAPVVALLSVVPPLVILATGWWLLPPRSE